jgi:hypothetical protein
MAQRINVDFGVTTQSAYNPSLGQSGRLNGRNVRKGRADDTKNREVTSLRTVNFSEQDGKYSQSLFERNVVRLLGLYDPRITPREEISDQDSETVL